VSHPKVEPPTVILSVDRVRGILTVWVLDGLIAESRFYRKGRRFSVSMGMEGWQAPGGFHIITSAERNPDWEVPDSDWARELGLRPGTIIPGGDPENPLKKRWLGVTPPAGGIGIHGSAPTHLDQPHGCIKMRPHHVVELFDMVPIGTPIFIE
jgi:lipoprotein-anchoring transpeptidase ErfK/SrfK